MSKSLLFHCVSWFFARRRRGRKENAAGRWAARITFEEEDEDVGLLSGLLLQGGKLVSCLLVPVGMLHHRVHVVCRLAVLQVEVPVGMVAALGRRGSGRRAADVLRRRGNRSPHERGQDTRCEDEKVRDERKRSIGPSPSARRETPAKVASSGVSAVRHFASSANRHQG